MKTRSVIIINELLNGDNSNKEQLLKIEENGVKSKIAVVLKTKAIVSALREKLESILNSQNLATFEKNILSFSQFAEMDELKKLGLDDLIIIYNALKAGNHK